MIRSFKNKSQWGSLQHLTPWHLIVPTPGSQHMAGSKAPSPGPCSLASLATLGPKALPQGLTWPRVVSRAERVRVTHILRDKAVVC